MATALDVRISSKVVLSSKQQMSQPAVQLPRASLRLSAAPVAVAPTLRILCYGDSLTAGWCGGGTTFEPYGPHLADSLQQLGINCEVSHCGLCGFRATEMEAAAHSSVTQPDSAGHVGSGLAYILDSQACPDVVIIMAGTNDMAKGKDIGKALRSTRKLHSMCHSRGVPTVALAPPFHDHRKSLLYAKLLSSWCRYQEDVLTFINPEDLVPRSAGGAYWGSDALHLTQAGYKAFGQSLAQALHSIFRQEFVDTSGAVPRQALVPAALPLRSPPQTPRAVSSTPRAVSSTPRGVSSAPLTTLSPAATTKKVIKVRRQSAASASPLSARKFESLQSSQPSIMLKANARVSRSPSLASAVIRVR
mmetsp:Transcript_44397/g.105164  ORF Transcript_44397/g.105164 Transcript_44397/m.105164 type:complete len:361 (-) Transcript_44397:208-1290(-)